MLHICTAYCFEFFMINDCHTKLRLVAMGGESLFLRNKNSQVNLKRVFHSHWKQKFLSSLMFTFHSQKWEKRLVISFFVSFYPHLFTTLELYCKYAFTVTRAHITSGKRWQKCAEVKPGQSELHT